MGSEKYAVVIVTYNRIDLLKECIKNIENQTVAAENIIIVNNASTDGTTQYLKKITDEKYTIINLEENIGGAGGFATAIKNAMDKSVDNILIIDDDAMIQDNYMELILLASKKHPQYKAFAGTVKVDGKIDIFHRKNKSKVGFMQKLISEENYQKESFECELASFCGMVVKMEVVRKIGLPHADYFIWHDDTEYSLRINKYSKFLVIPDAVLNHKTKLNNIVKPRRYDWREYYAVRNRIMMVKEHGNLLDRIVNNTDIFVRVIFRNWLFGVIKRDGYDWKYENEIVKKAVKDVKSNQLENLIIKHM